MISACSDALSVFHLITTGDTDGAEDNRSKSNDLDDQNEAPTTVRVPVRLDLFSTGVELIEVALQHNLHECIGVERVAECDRPGRIGIEGDNRFAPRGLVMAFQAAWMGYSALMWGIEVGCVRSPYEANPGGSPDVENTAQPGFAAYQPCLR